MPEDVRELYLTIWSEGAGCPEYVVTLNNKVGMAITIELGTEYINELTGRFSADTNTEREVAADVGKDVASQMQDELPLCEVFYGEDTDPCGDEVLVFLEKNLCREKWQEVKDIALQFFYEKFKEKFFAAISTLRTAKTNAEHVMHTTKYK